MPLLDTRLHKDLMGTFIADLVLQILSFMAQSERDNIKKRQAEGITAAQARGVHMGRPAKRAPEGFETILHQWENKQISIDEATALCGGVSEATFYRWLRKHRLSDCDH